MIVTGVKARRKSNPHSQEEWVADSNIPWANGRVTTPSWSSADTAMAPNKAGFEKRPNSGIV